MIKKLVGAALATSIVLTGGAALGTAPAQAASSTVTWRTAKVIRWVDGDTVRTSLGTVRLIGVDTPEVGRCGAGTATSLARTLAPAGSTIKLGNPASVSNKDRYGRHLRYVQRGTIDIGKRQIAKGARARYDGRDGYQWHPRQTSYRSTDSAHPNYRCTTGGGSTASTWAKRANTPVSSSNPDIDCGQIPAAYKPIRITGTDYHRLDADHDGWGCEG